jgi:hypothetical protein
MLRLPQFVARSADCCLVDESCGAIITWNFAISTLYSDGKIHQYFKCKLTEVHEVFSSTSIIHVNAVKDIAFVFHLDVLEHKLPNCAGMSRVFYTRYHYNIGNRLVSVDCHHHFPFSNIISESYPSRIWNSIIDIKEKVEKSLNDPKQNIIGVMELHLHKFGRQWCSGSLS